MKISMGLGRIFHSIAVHTRKLTNVYAALLYFYRSRLFRHTVESGFYEPPEKASKHWYFSVFNPAKQNPG